MGKNKHKHHNHYNTTDDETDGELVDKYDACEDETCDCTECSDDECTCNECKCENSTDNTCGCNQSDEPNVVGSKEQEYLELAQRMKAEFDNYKRRTEAVVSSSYQNGVAGAVSKLLPVLDSFKQAKDKITDENTLVGVELIYNQLITALSELGVKKIECVGKQFDPNFHNAVLTDSKDDIDDGVVLEEFQEGFTLGDKVIRHSVVKINKLNN